MHCQRIAYTIRVCFYNLMGFLSRLRVFYMNEFSHDMAGISHKYLDSYEVYETSSAWLLQNSIFKRSRNSREFPYFSAVILIVVDS